MIKVALPPLLQEHINFLQDKGFEIGTNEGEGQEICIVFKNYPIPNDIWDRNKTDLLVLAYPTYPNVKMDMFWVDPPLTLKSKKQANAVSPENKCGKSWQRFSWHVKTWNPAHDNLITYLNVINDRLEKDE